jgi:hypothetical protein
VAIFSASPFERTEACGEHLVDASHRAALIGRQRRRLNAAAVAELGPGAAGLDDRDADAERGDLGRVVR